MHTSAPVLTPAEESFLHQVFLSHTWDSTKVHFHRTFSSGKVKAYCQGGFSTLPTQRELSVLTPFLQQFPVHHTLALHAPKPHVKRLGG